MAACILYDKRSVANIVATSAQDGYPASNIANESVKRPWRATTLGANDVTINFAAGVGIHSLCLHDVNFVSATIQKSADGVTFGAAGTITNYADRKGRLRGRIVVNDPSVKALKIQIGAGASSDGRAWWRIGASYPFGTLHVVPADLIFPVTEEVVEPAVSTELANKQVAEASLGAHFSKVDTVWQREATESLQTLIQKTRGTTVWFDAGTSDYPEQQWPFYMQLQASIKETFDRFRFSKPTLSFTERI